MQLATVAWPDVERYLDRSTGVVIPVGSTEQHGLNGLIGTDALCAEAVAGGLADRADALVTPAIWATPAQFNLGFPGTVSIRAGTLMALVADIVDSLTAAGFRAFYFLNAHGANLAPLRAVFHDLRAAPGAADRRFRVRSWWEFPDTDALRRELYAGAEGLHATPSEVAITMALRPGAVGSRPETPAVPLDPSEIAELAGDNHGPAAEHRARFPDGRVGSHPALATAEAGERLLATAVREAADDYLRFLDAGSRP